MAWAYLVIWTIISCQNAPAPAQPPKRFDFSKLTVADLIAEYEAAGLALEGTHDGVADFPVSATAFGASPGSDRFRALEAEIIRRGPALVPTLMDFLRREVPLRRPRPARGMATAFTAHIIDLLVAIGDPRPVPLLVEILAGFQGQAGQHQRLAAVRGLEKLSYCRFRHLGPPNDTYADAVPHLAAQETHKLDLSEVARLQGDWLEGEGKDPRQWLTLARRRARELLDGHDLNQVYSSAMFLEPPPQPNLFERMQVGPPRLGRARRNGPPRDDAVDKTLERIARHMKDFEKSGLRYTSRGNDVPVHIANWVQLLTRYGPRARTHADLLLRLQREAGIENWSGFAELRRVGGESILAYAFECLPKAPANSRREIQYLIDRWAGRQFATDQERLAWWQANREKSQEARLREGLPTYLAQLDAGDRKMIWILGELLPDLPEDLARRYSQFAPIRPGDTPRGSSETTLAAWYKKHEGQHVYDEQQGGFRLAGAEKPGSGR